MFPDTPPTLHVFHVTWIKHTSNKQDLFQIISSLIDSKTWNSVSDKSLQEPLLYNIYILKQLFLIISHCFFIKHIYLNVDEFVIRYQK